MNPHIQSAIQAFIGRRWLRRYNDYIFRNFEESISTVWAYYGEEFARITDNQLHITLPNENVHRGLAMRINGLLEAYGHPANFAYRENRWWEDGTPLSNLFPHSYAYPLEAPEVLQRRRAFADAGEIDVPSCSEEDFRYEKNTQMILYSGHGNIARLKPGELLLITMRPGSIEFINKILTARNSRRRAEFRTFTDARHTGPYLGILDTATGLWLHTNNSEHFSMLPRITESISNYLESHLLTIVYGEENTPIRIGRIDRNMLAPNGRQYASMHSRALSQIVNGQLITRNVRVPSYQPAAGLGDLSTCSSVDCTNVYVRDPENPSSICPHCADIVNNAVCHHCHEPIGARRHVHHNGSHYHMTCFDNLPRCSRCDTVVSEGSLQQVRGRRLCPDCVEHEERHIYDIRNYHSQSRDYTFIGDGPLYVGLEIEIDNGRDRWKLCKELRELWNNNIILERDGSLSDDGMEAVLSPISIDIAVDHPLLTETIKKMKAYGFKAQDAHSSCGMHINISRDQFSESEEERISGIFYRFSSEFSALSQRKKGLDYARLPNWIIANCGFQGHLTRDDEDSHNYFKNYEHYAGVSFEKEEVIEFRIFAMSLNMNSVNAKIELVRNLCAWVKEKDCDPFTIDDLIYFKPTKYLIPYAARLLKRYEVPSTTWMSKENIEQVSESICSTIRASSSYPIVEEGGQKKIKLGAYTIISPTRMGHYYSIIHSAIESMTLPALPEYAISD